MEQFSRALVFNVHLLLGSFFMVSTPRVLCQTIPNDRKHLTCPQPQIKKSTGSNIPWSPIELYPATEESIMTRQICLAELKSYPILFSLGEMDWIVEVLKLVTFTWNIVHQDFNVDIIIAGIGQRK